MNCRCSNTLERPNQSAAAMTLVELIGVLGIILILAAVAIPVAIRFLDRIASEREVASLKALGDAIENGILRTRSIPNQTSWHVFIATNSGMDIRSVTNNLRNRQRVLVLPASGGFYDLLPYTQTSAGTPTPPQDLRMLLISSISGTLPVNSEVLDPTDFQAIWDAQDGTFPVVGRPWASTWTGSQADVKIQRINLAPHFVNLVLSTYKSGTNGVGHYSFEGKSPILDAPQGDGTNAYFLRGTQLNLRSSTNITTAPDLTQILQEDSSWVFENDVWQSSIVGPRPAPGLSDLTDIVDAFLKATPNPNAHWYNLTEPRTQQVLVVATMRNYMSNYSVWATNGFTPEAKTSLGLESNRVDMMDAIQGLYSTSSKWTNVPPPNMP